MLFDDLGNTTRTDGASTLTDGEADGLLHGDRGDEFDRDRDVVAGHDHLDSLGEGDGAGDVRGTEVELRAVVREERSVASAFLLTEDVDLGLELLVRLDRTGLGDDLAALDVLLLHAAEKDSDVVAGLCGVEELAEHFDVGDGGLLGVAETDDLDFFTLLEDTALDTAGGHGAATFDVEHVLDGEEEGLILRTLGHWDVVIDGLDEGEDVLLLLGVSLEGLLGAALDDGNLVTGEVVALEEIADLHLDEVEELRIVDEVDLVHEDDERRNADLTGEQDVLTGLGHRAVSGADDEDRSVHLGGAGDHVFDVIGVSRAVDVRVVALVALVLDVGGGNGDTAGLFLGSRVDLVVGAGLGFAGLSQHGGDGGGEGGLAVVNVPDRADVHVILFAFEGFFCHMGGLCWWLFFCLVIRSSGAHDRD